MKLTIGSKLGLGFGLVLLILAISGLVTITQIRIIDKHLKEITEVKEPTSAAAYNMNIGLLRTGYGLLGYLQDHDREHLDRIKRGRDGFREYQKKYHELVETQEGKQVGVTVDKGYAKFTAMADELIKIEDEQTQKMKTLLKNLVEMDDILDDKIQAFIKRDDPQVYEKIQTTMEMEININGIAKGLGNYLRTRDAKYIERVHKDEKDFKYFMEMYEGLNLVTCSEKLTQACVFS